MKRRPDKIVFHFGTSETVTFLIERRPKVGDAGYNVVVTKNGKSKAFNTAQKPNPTSAQLLLTYF